MDLPKVPYQAIFKGWTLRVPSITVLRLLLRSPNLGPIRRDRLLLPHRQNPEGYCLGDHVQYPAA